MRTDVFTFDPSDDGRRVILTEDTDAADGERYGLLVRNGQDVAVVTLPADAVDDLSLALRSATKRRRSAAGPSARANPELSP